MTAAIAAATRGATVTLYEQRSQVGQKILGTGSGKCNLGNMQMGWENFYSSEPEHMRVILEKFTLADTMDFFADLGVLIREKNGHLYPYAEQAKVVLDAFKLKLNEMGINVICNNAVTAVARQSGTAFNIYGLKYDKVIIASGSVAGKNNGPAKSGLRIAKASGHRIIPQVPGLCRLHSKDEFLPALAGVRSRARATLMVDGEKAGESVGEIQFNQGILSGIVIFQLSRIAAYALADERDVSIRVDFFPDFSVDEYMRICKKRIGLVENSRKTVAEFLVGMSNKRVSQVLIKKAGFYDDDWAADLSDVELESLMMAYRSLEFRISKTDGKENAQVVAGGVALSELDENLQSLKVPGLYFCGEVVDVDARCGGYNLQWAWSSGHVVGQEAAS